MTWSAILSALLSTFGPLLAEWLKKWLEDKLKAASGRLGAPAEYRTFGSAAAALFDAAVADTPRFAFGRRSLLRHLRHAALVRGDELARGPVALTPAEVDTIRDAAIAADE